MKIVRRIAAVVGMILAIVFFVGLVGLIVGIWLGRQPIVDGVSGVLAPFEYAGRSASDLIDQSSAELTAVQVRLDAAQVRAEEFLAAPEQQAEAGAALRDELSAALGADIGAVATQLQTQLAAVSRAVQSADQAVTAAAQLGLIPRGQMSGARLAELDQEVTTLRSQVDQIAAQIENPKGAAAAELARSLQTILGNADLSLGKLTTRLDEIDAAVVEYNDQVAAIRNVVQPSITIGTLLFTLIFGWLAAGQVSLFMHLLAWFRRP